MKGLDISEKFYKEYGEPMLLAEFSDIFDKIAVGLCGSGSQCFGYDDAVSRDHDFDAGFIIFLPEESVVDRKRAFQLERAYSKLPKEYEGVKRALLNPVGGNRTGVIRTADFFTEKVGDPYGNLSVKAWLTISENYLAEAINGKIFVDNYGEVSRIRQKLSAMPKDIMLKKLAGNLLVMAQAGQYNYNRCIAHGETVAAQFAVNEFVNAVMRAAFLLNDRYMPYYKWSFKAFKELTKLSSFADSLEFLLTSDNEESAETKYLIIEDIAKAVIDLLVCGNLTKAACLDLEKHAYSVNDLISDSELRNISVFAGV